MLRTLHKDIARYNQVREEMAGGGVRRRVQVGLRDKIFVGGWREVVGRLRGGGKEREICKSSVLVGETYWTSGSSDMVIHLGYTSVIGTYRVRHKGPGCFAERSHSGWRSNVSRLLGLGGLLSL